jgi:hypothetical protein
LHDLQFHPPMQHVKIIDRLGGYVAVAEAVGRDASTVNRWQRTGIPVAHWPAVLAVAKDQGWRLTVRNLHDGVPQRVKRQSETGTLSSAAA